MQNIYRNQYKRHDIFSCNHSDHHRFGGNVSTYYVLSEKNCYPQGCINFIWRCRLLNKGHSCPKKFTHVGRKCFSCKEYYEEKYCQAPRLKVSDEKYREFLREKEDFDHWVSQNDGRLVEIDAEIVSIKPNLIPSNGGPPQKFRFNGWILVLDGVYVNYDLFDDTAFAWISQKTQERFGFRDGDIFEAQARFNFSYGRLIFNRTHNIEIKQRGEGIQPEMSDIIAATQTATKIPVQPEKCIRCSQGILVENNNLRKDKDGRRRSLICLEGIRNPSECIYHLEDKLQE